MATVAKAVTLVILLAVLSLVGSTVFSQKAVFDTSALCASSAAGPWVPALRGGSIGIQAVAQSSTSVGLFRVSVLLSFDEENTAAGSLGIFSGAYGVYFILLVQVLAYSPILSFVITFYDNPFHDLSAASMLNSAEAAAAVSRVGWMVDLHDLDAATGKLFSQLKRLPPSAAILHGKRTFREALFKHPVVAFIQCLGRDHSKRSIFSNPSFVQPLQAEPAVCLLQLILLRLQRDGKLQANREQPKWWRRLLGHLCCCRQQSRPGGAAALQVPLAGEVKAFSDMLESLKK
jgi:hypothetical protein